MQEFKIKRFNNKKTTIVESTPDIVRLHDKHLEFEWYCVAEVEDETLGKQEKHYQGHCRIKKESIYHVEAVHNNVQDTFDCIIGTIGEAASYSFSFETFEKADQMSSRIWEWLSVTV